ncbi:hypothetical protein [Ancylobacter radicis]|uniref:Uncharacterized protein n=1 Tax=Ancylobacter radicis TaxID=2836179 RepID=A0ABS5RAF9_9HYPH|nr:hypothetical protein [Ancylobacter radicis]MBS9478654.1 hypothetical protein [Ancylobacter radicis]
MKLNTFGAQMVAMLGIEMSTFTETSRALREQSAQFEHDPSGRFGPDILKGRVGPGGGIDVDPFRAAFMLIALIGGGLRKEAARNVWRIWHFRLPGYTRGGFVGEEPQAQPLPSCGLTGEGRFGEAVLKIIEDEDLAARVTLLSVSPLGAEIVFDGGEVSRFTAGIPSMNRPRFYYEAKVDGVIIQGCARLFGGSATRPNRLVPAVTAAQGELV